MKRGDIHWVELPSDGGREQQGAGQQLWSKTTVTPDGFQRCS